tara:strand:+ start:388 stop:567 length:180 start_codon:yes stop_codon:yes gene_type:complete
MSSWNKFFKEMEYITSIFSKKINSNKKNENELKKYKKMMDDGLITRKDYDAKKKELLGL